MAIDGPINTLVLQEFRLHAASTADEAARIIAGFAGGSDPAVPLLTSIDDRRDVATVRGLHAGETTDAPPGQRDALEPLVASWQPPKQYGPRISERSNTVPAHYRLAVTESGINNAAGDPPAIVPPSATDESSRRLDLLWIGVPHGTHAGLLVLLGSDEDRTTVRPDPRVWPLPLSNDLGVRIYESQE